MYYSSVNLRSYNALFNFIIGERGVGKTYDLKKYAIQYCIKHKCEFTYVRRYKDEIKDISKFFNDIREEFPDVKLEVKNKEFYANDKLIGYAHQLSTAKMKKSVSYPHVKIIIFDEFIIDKGLFHYLPDDVGNFLEYYETISRMRDVRVFFLSNAITITNQYFTYFNIDVPDTGIKLYKKYIAVERVTDIEYREAKRKTKFGQIIDGTTYGKYVIDNVFLRDNISYIEEKSNNSIHRFSFLYNGRYYGVWTDYKTNKEYVSEKNNYLYSPCFTINIDERNENTLLVTKLKSSKIFKLLIDNYMNGILYFDNQKTKNNVCEMLKKFV